VYTAAAEKFTKYRFLSRTALFLSIGLNFLIRSDKFMTLSDKVPQLRFDFVLTLYSCLADFVFPHGWLTKSVQQFLQLASDESFRWDYIRKITWLRPSLKIGAKYNLRRVKFAKSKLCLTGKNCAKLLSSGMPSVSVEPCEVS